MRLFSFTYRSRVKGEGKKAKNSGRARRYAHARNANKTFAYAFLDKYRETRGAHLCLSHRTDKETWGAAPKNDTSESERVTFRCVRLPKARGRERTETEGDQWGCFNRAMCCFIFLSCARCSVQSRWLRPSSFRFAVVDRVNFQVRPNRFVVVFRVQPLRVNCWSGRRLRKPRCLPVPQWPLLPLLATRDECDRRKSSSLLSHALRGRVPLLPNVP